MYIWNSNKKKKKWKTLRISCYSTEFALKTYCQEKQTKKYHSNVYLITNPTVTLDKLWIYSYSFLYYAT